MRVLERLKVSFFLELVNTKTSAGRLGNTKKTKTTGAN